MIREEIQNSALELFPVREKENKKGVGTYDPNFPRRKAFCDGASVAGEMIIDRACEWLYNNWMGEDYYITDIIEGLRKTMKKEI